MKETWMLKNKSADFKHICETFNVSLPMARLIVNRGYCEDDDIHNYLYPDLKQLPSYTLLKDINKAVSIIKKAIDNGSHIRIIGDYDVDGVTSTYLLMQALEELGAYVSYRIPDRIADGYGISFGMIDEALTDGIDLIITCDNGIAAGAQIEYAKQQGLMVVVTDHHDIPEVLPPADCIINPKQTDCDYPNKGICGAVVAAKLCEALFSEYGFGGFIEKHLDILAMATVCDVMELTGENRVIVKLGLEEVNKKTNMGLKALIEVNGLQFKKISCYHLGFVLGPCLNATGRLETADSGVELLRTDNPKDARCLAEHLKELNEIRKDKTQKGIEKAVDTIEYGPDKDDSVLVVYISGCHESLAGIIAGRIREKYNRPTIIFTQSMADDEVLKGSGRSTEVYNMFQEISKCRNLLLKFGGHPMAAGLSIRRDNLEQFRKELNENCTVDLSAAVKKVLIDIRMILSYSDHRFVNELELLEPTGNGNEKPVLADSNVIVKRIQRFGKEANFLKMDVTDSNGVPVTVKMFTRTEDFISEFEKVYGRESLNNTFNGKGNEKVHFIYYPELNEYNGITSVQIHINSWMFPEDSKKSEQSDKENDNLRNKANEKNNYAQKTKSGRCYIFGAGSLSELPVVPKEDDYIIAADGGYEHVLRLGLVPDELIGDFDSLTDAFKAKVPDSTKITRFPVEKDDTDTALAVKKTIEKGYNTIYLLGCTGGNRIEHTLANISLLGYGAEKNVRIYMFDGNSTMMAVKNKKVVFDEKCSGNLSVFAFGGEAFGVTVKNLKYTLDDAELFPEVSLGVSNSFIGKKAEISVKKGTLLIVGDYLPKLITIE
ncbi:MAG: single-stranded-DNA-specific exonuclease RecJ [Lachnospiraceae bacterium]